MDEFMRPENFIEEKIMEDIKTKNLSRLQFRHPPEPSGYLHIGHVRNIWLNYGLARRFNGICNLRYDDTNPTKESQEFVESIQEDVRWLGYKWENIYYATDYFQENYETALKLIKEGKAYIDDLTPEEVTNHRGTLTTPGKNSPYRSRNPEENLLLFEKMKNGEFPQGKCCLRAKIDMSHPNMCMRDPVLYRIQYSKHQRIGNKWNIYPTYDFSHPLDDALEGVTHSICGPEFEVRRELYDWVIENSGLPNRPRQIEYANLSLDGVILGKRHIKKMVEEGQVSGYDDPRLYTLRGLRRRGVLPQSLLSFVEAAGVGKSEAIHNMDYLNHFIRNDLNEIAKRVMAVLSPVKLVIDNYPEEMSESISLPSYPQKEGNNETHLHLFSKVLYIERDDFMITPPKKFHRLYPGNTVRLKGAYIITCTGYECNEAGEITCIHAEYDPATKSGSEGAFQKVKGTIHWVNPLDAVEAEVRMIEQDHISSCHSFIEKGVIFQPEERYQFIRNGYFCLDQDSDLEKGRYVFNRTVGLKDSKKRAL